MEMSGGGGGRELAMGSVGCLEGEDELPRVGLMALD